MRDVELIAELAAQVGLRLTRTRMPSGAPAMVVGGALLWSGDRTEDALRALAAETLRAAGRPFTAEDAAELAQGLAARSPALTPAEGMPASGARTMPPPGYKSERSDLTRSR